MRLCMISQEKETAKVTVAYYGTDKRAKKRSLPITLW